MSVLGLRPAFDGTVVSRADSCGVPRRDPVRFRNLAMCRRVSQIMNHERQTSGVLHTLLRAAILASVAWGPAVVGMERSTLTRVHDPVVVPMASIDPRPDRPASEYRVVRANAGEIGVIPYQFDARDEDGEIVFDDDGDTRAIGPRDELVFMVRDIGERMSPSLLPADANAAWEIEIIDPRSGQHGWAYLLHYAGPPPASSPVRYAAFDPTTNEARGWYYSVRYAPERNYYTSMRILPGPERSGPELLNQMRIRIDATFSLLLADWHPQFTEENFTARTDGVKNGPVRAIRRVEQALDLGRFFPDMPSGRVYSYYYFSSFVTPTTLSVPWAVLRSVRDFEFRGINDFKADVVGMTYRDGANRAGVRYGSAADVPLDTQTDHDWWAISGDVGTCVHVFEIPSAWKQWGVSRNTVFIDEATGEHAADGDGALTHAAGYRLANLGRVRASGSHHLTLATVVWPEPFRDGDEAGPVAMVRQPLETRVRQLR